MKYNEEIKKQAVSAAKDGMSLAQIQTSIGPNPKATMRYLAKEGIVYKDLKEELKASGKLKSSVKKQETKKNKGQKAVQAEEIIEE